MTGELMNMQGKNQKFCSSPIVTPHLIPVLRYKARVFLCRLEYHTDSLTVQDKLYSHGQEDGRGQPGGTRKSVSSLIRLPAC